MYEYGLRQEGLAIVNGGGGGGGCGIVHVYPSLTIDIFRFHADHAHAYKKMKKN